MTKRKAILVDIDGTVANVQHRLHLIQNGSRKWNEFFELAHRDTPIKPTIEVVTAMRKQGYAIIALTARPEQYRDQTKEWLGEHAIYTDELVMRPDKDYRPDHEVKMDELRKIQKFYDVVFALEDRINVVMAYRAAGVHCFHVADDDNSDEKNWNGETFLTILVGPSGAGKSTYLKTNNVPESAVVSSDEIREELTCWRRSDSEATWAKLTDKDHARTWGTVHGLIATRLGLGLRTWLDSTNIHARDRKAVLSVVPKTQRVTYVLIDRPLDQKLVTKGWRSEELVHKHHAAFQSGIKYALNGDGLDYVDVVDTRTK